MIARRTVFIVFALLAGLAIQTGFLGRFALFGAKPELLLLIVVAVAMVEGPVAGAVAGFGAGAVTDAMTALPDGLTALVFMLAGTSVGSIRAMYQRPSAWLPAVMVGATTMLTLASLAALGSILGVFAGSMLRTAVRVFLVGAYGAILTPLFYPLLVRGLEGQKPVLGSVVVVKR